MNTVSECFDKVKTDCFKFIKSQETSKEKFKEKEKMLKSFLIPACFWITSKTKSKNPFFQGLQVDKEQVKQQLVQYQK